MMKPYLLASAITLVFCLATSIGYGKMLLTWPQFALYAGFSMAVICLIIRLDASSRESFRCWRFSWTFKITIFLGLAFAALVGFVGAYGEVKPWHAPGRFLQECWSGFLFIGWMGFLSGCLLLLFVPLYLMSGSSKSKSAWEFAKEHPAPSNNSLVIVISRWLQELS